MERALRFEPEAGQPGIDRPALLAETLDEVTRPPIDGPVATGLADLDEVTGGGLWPGELVLVTAVSGTGLSMFALGLAGHAAVTVGEHALYVSTEHDVREITQRVISSAAKVPLSHLRGARLDDVDRDKIARDRERSAQAPLSC